MADVPGFTLPIIQDVRDSALCGPCGGRCCKRMPGASVPGDWGATPAEVEAAVTAALATRLWSIDKWDGDPRKAMRLADDFDAETWWNGPPEINGYFVRPAREGRDLAVVTDYPWDGGRCALLTDRGCSLQHEKRPYICRALVPGPGEACYLQDAVGDNAKRIPAMAWLPYNDFFVSLIQREGARL